MACAAVLTGRGYLDSNARDVLKDRISGTKHISISASNSADQVIITVADSGGGIPDDALPRIFEPFFTTKEIGQGTGLGLSISYGIISDMGGTITVENMDQGALFTIALPIFEEDIATV